ncbi:MAG: hypothetical protein SGI74_11770 [Oligoflexia bacterium]|nr:hypothetical protein [Oligoflexia bacterium]
MFHLKNLLYVLIILNIGCAKQNSTTQNSSSPTDAKINIVKPPITDPIDALTITNKPLKFAGLKSASFSFSTLQSGSTFQCKLDAGAAVPCTSPFNYTNLTDGIHYFTVFATNNAGTMWASENFNWNVDENFINLNTSNPPTTSTSTSATITFNSDAHAPTFQCKLDSGSFAPCTSGVQLSNLSTGRHTFIIQVTNGLGTATLTGGFYWDVL